MNNEINILHLSDLHFGAESTEEISPTSIAKRENVLNSLINKFKDLDEIWWPDIVIISGDIGWRGKSEDYRKAKEWINNLLTELNLTPNELIICAGNHDLDRDKTSGLIRSPDCREADNCLEIENIDNLIIPFTDYSDFCEDIGIPELNIAEKKYLLMGQRNIKGIKFVVLNSSWFSRDNNDDGRLFIGFPQLELMKSKNQLIDPEKYNEEQISIGILHHPFDKLAENEKYIVDRVATYSYLSEHVHIILSGHAHNQAIAVPDRHSGRAWVFIAGATYSGSNYSNNSSIFKIDIDNRIVNRISYEYDPRYGDWRKIEDDESYSLKINMADTEQTGIGLAWNNYCNEIKNDFKTIKDVSAIGHTAQLPLEDMYVFLRLSEPDRILEDNLAFKKDSKLLKDDFINLEKEKVFTKKKIFDAEDAIDKFDKLVLVGDPGSGKTTLLRHITLKCCTKNMEKGEIISIPIPLTLREYSESKKDLRDYIDEIFDKYQFPEAKEFIEEFLSQGKCTLLLDGFDELVTNDNRDVILNQVQKFVEKYPDINVVVTSRTADYNDELKGFSKFELMEFDDGQIKQFIDNWFGRTDSKKADSVFNAIMENERIKALARTPLIIAIIAIIFEEDSKLPQERAELYSRCVEVLLNRWDLQRHVENTYHRYQKELILKKLAFYAHRNNEKIMSEEEVKIEIHNHIKQAQLEDNDTDPLLNEIWKRSNLLRQISMDSYDFLHLSFQEYFTALELFENRLLDGIGILIEHFNEPWWEEPTLLFAGISKDAAPLIKRMDEEIEEDMFCSKLMLFGKLITVAYTTDYSYKEKVSDELWDIYRTSEFLSLKEKAINLLYLIKPDDLVNSLIKELNEENNDNKWSTVNALGITKDERAVESLLETLKNDTDTIVREKTLNSLKIIGNEKIIGPLLETLKNDTSELVRWKSAEVLGVIGGEDVVEPLLESLKNDENDYVRGLAAESLGIIGGEDVVEPLLEALEKDNGYVRGAAAIGLGHIGCEEVVEPLLEALKNDENDRTRWGIALALSIMREEIIIEPLLEALKNDEETKFKWGAVLALGNMGKKIVVEPLLEALKNENDDIQISTIYTLKSIGDKRAVEPLLELLKKDIDGSVRGPAIETLGIMGDENLVEPLIELLKVEEDEYVLYEILKALGFLGDEKVIDILQCYLTSEVELADKKVKDAAFEAIEKISKRVKRII